MVLGGYDYIWQISVWTGIADLSWIRTDDLLRWPLDPIVLSRLLWSHDLFLSLSLSLLLPFSQDRKQGKTGRKKIDLHMLSEILICDGPLLPCHHCHKPHMSLIKSQIPFDIFLLLEILLFVHMLESPDSSQSLWEGPSWVLWFFF